MPTSIFLSISLCLSVNKEKVSADLSADSADLSADSADLSTE
jgi:hypothetical protein